MGIIYPNSMLSKPRGLVASGFDPISAFGSDLALWLDPSYGVYTDRSTQLTAASSQYWSSATNSGATNKLTVSLWVKPNGLGTYMLVTESNAAETAGWELRCDGATFYMYIFDSAPSYPNGSKTSVFADGVWTHVAVVYDGTQTGNANRLKLYVNGAEQSLAFATTIPSTISVSGLTRYVGRYAGAGVYANACFDSLCITPVALSAADVTAMYNSGAGVVYADLPTAQRTAIGASGSWYDFDGDGLDSHGTNDLTAVNSPTYTTGIASGLAGDGDLVSLIVPRAGPNLTPPSYAGRPTWYANGGRPYISFDGVNDGLQTASNISLGAFTIAGNIYASGTAGVLYEHSADAGGNDGCYLYGTTSATINTRRTIIDNQDLTLNWAVDATWRTISHVYDGTHAGHGLRFNGASQSLSAGVTQNPGTATAAAKLNICCRNQTSLFSTARLGDFVAINANLSAAQLAQLEPWLIARRAA